MENQIQDTIESRSHSWAGISSFIVGVIFMVVIAWSFTATNLEDFFLAHFGDILVVSFVCSAVAFASALVAVYGLLSKSKKVFSFIGLAFCLASFFYFAKIVLQIFSD